MKPTENQGEREKLPINRGVELMLRKKTKGEKPKSFQVSFEKMVSLFNREFHICFDLSFDARKQNQ
jgi:regulator of replication initiation timing